ncbi:MAG TPA: ATP-binding protein [Pyrinomonadaceae bacterium]|nr:ATP-binding protein [Pyrinomonadaceae bacterium]
MTRHKPFLTYFIFCAIPLLLLAGLNYWRGLQTLNSTLSTVAQDDLNSFNVAVDEVVRRQEAEMLRLPLDASVQALVNKTATDSSFLHSFVDHDGPFRRLTVFDLNRQPVWDRPQDRQDPSSRPAPDVPQPDPSVWTVQGNQLFERAGTNNTIEYTVRLHDQTGANNLGAIVGVLDVGYVLSQAARGLETATNRANTQGAMVLVVDQSGKLIYDSRRGYKQLNTSEALPGFDSISSAMAAHQSGLGEFSLQSGPKYLAAYSPIPRLNVSAAVARSRSDSTFSAHIWGLAGFVFALVASFAGASVLQRSVQTRTRGIARVREDLSAIAKGELDRRIILQSSDDARGIADNINVVTERLRAQIAREEESRQFESFLRLSAMLTHDLKNAIEGLSLTVGNMEKHFDNPQFRADAMKGLTSATDKLKALVARLSRPLTSLSGEHKRPTNVDLVPIIQRVISLSVEPLRGKHTIVLRLPPTLFAYVDAVRVEEVIENLVLNALEAMVDKGGTLTIEGSQTANGQPMFSVSDTGRGMSRSFIEHRLYRPFSTTKRTGIGLGLYTCREVIKASSGSIEVESVEGAGTTFRVVLPSIPHDRRS